MKVDSIFLPKELRNSTLGETHEGEQEVLIAYKIESIKFDELYNSYDKLSGLKCEISESLFKDSICNLIYAGVYLTSQNIKERNTTEVITAIFDQYLPYLERFSNMNNMFGIYVRARLKGELDSSDGKYIYYLPNDKLSQVVQDIPKKDRSYDFFLNGSKTYASDILISDIFTKLPKNIPEELIKVIGASDIDGFAKSRYRKNLKASIVEESLVFDGSNKS